MKVFNYLKKTTAYIILPFICISCATTSEAAKCTAPDQTAAQTAVQQESESAAKKIKTAAASSEKAFKEKIAKTAVTVVSVPKQTTKGVPFSSPYVIAVKDLDGNGVSSFPLTVSYPSSRINDSIVYATSQIITGEDGTVSFMPDVPAYPFNDKITFYPTPVTSDAAVVQLAYEAGVTAEFKVISEYSKTSCVLYVYSFNENGKVETNFFPLFQELYNKGISSGNSPISSISYLDRPVDQLYRATKEIVGNQFVMMLFGTVKYVSAPEKTEKGYKCSLTADIQCVHMTDGAVLYRTQQTETAEAENKYKSVENCKKALADKIVNAIKYGL